MTIPFLGVPVLNRYDHLVNMEASVDAEVGRYYVLDNGGRYEGEPVEWARETHVCRPGANLGFGASLNLMIKANVKADWWMFANDDIVFSPGDMASVAETMWAAQGPTVAHFAGCGYSAFAVNADAIEKVGFWDESYHPAYCEDCDWNWRANLIGGVSFIFVPGSTKHLGSQTLLRANGANARTYPANVIYHNQKWNGHPCGAETWTTPFNAGGDPAVTTAPKLSRLRDLAW